MYVQIDGGPENANKLVLAVLSFLVAKRVGGIQRIVLTRLPVGHTHEDIDGIFGRISQYIMKRHILTPQAYKKAIYDAIGSKVGSKVGIQVVDLVVIPNYNEFFKGCVDREFGKFKNARDAKLQFTIEAVLIDPAKYPVGVKLTCRSFVQTEYPILFPDEEAQMGINVDVIRCVDFPAEGDRPINVLLDLPRSGRIVPQPFAKDFLSDTTKYLRYMRRYYKKEASVTEDLDAFEKNYPDVQDVNEWVERNPEDFYIPFESAFHNFDSIDPGILPMQYLDLRKNSDKELLSNYRKIPDIDTVTRSSVIATSDRRLYYTDHEPVAGVASKDIKTSMTSLGVRSKQSQKFLKAIGARYFDAAENIDCLIRSIFEQVNEKGTVIPHFRIQTVLEDDDENKTFGSER